MDAIKEAFADRTDIQQRIVEQGGLYPGTFPLFADIAQYIIKLKISKESTRLPDLTVEPQSKKRKLEPEAADTAAWTDVQSYNDISFSIPQRKKLKLGISPAPSQGFRGTNAGGEQEIIAKWSQAREVFCLPVPEKAQAQWNFCVLLNGPNGSSEQVLWTVPESVPKDGTLDPHQQTDETYRVHVTAKINEALKKQKRRVVVPNDDEFVSQLVQSHRKGEKAYHVKAFRGAKDGFLFFLFNGIFWGFKKPLEFFPFDAIESVSYTSVLQRTFNLNVSYLPSMSDPPQEIEFSMLDQEDFAGIDAYIKRHQLQDASMADKRRAKKHNVNGVPKGDGEDHEGGDEEEGELQKAAREAKDLNEDDDDEEDDDENFDPGSEGESEGEGASSEEEGSTHGDHDDHS